MLSAYCNGTTNMEQYNEDNENSTKMQAPRFIKNILIYKASKNKTILNATEKSLLFDFYRDKAKCNNK